MLAGDQKKKQDSRFHLMLVSSSHIIGGYETRLENIKRGLDPGRFKVTGLQAYPLYKAHTVPSKQRAAYRERLLTPVVGEEIIEVALRNQWDVRGIIGIFRVFLREKPDAVLFFGMGMITFGVPVLARMAGVKHLIRTSGTVLDGVYPRGFRFLDRLCTKLTEIIVVPSAFLSREIQRVLRAPAKKIIVIPNGIRLKRFEPMESPHEARRELGLPDTVKVVGIVANLTPAKSHRLLFDSFRRVLQTESQVFLLVVGDGHLRSELESYVQALGIEKRVRFLGFRSDLKRVIPAFDVGVSSSSVETFGNAIVQMMVCGIPVVSTDVGAISEIIHHGREGLLVPYGDAEALAEAILHLLHHEEEARAIGLRGQELARSRYSSKAMIEKLESLLLSLG